MPLPEITDIWRCSVRWLLDDVEEAINVLHVRNPTQLPALTVASTLSAALVTNWQPNMCDDTDLVGIDVRPLTASGSTTETLTVGTASGDVTGINVPHQCALVCTWRTGVGGRSNRGRSYVPGLPTSALAGGDSSHWSAGQVNAWQADMEAFIAELDGNDLHLSVASYTNATARDVTEPLVRQSVFTQRRRVGSS